MFPFLIRLLFDYDCIFRWLSKLMLITSVGLFRAPFTFLFYLLFFLASLLFRCLRKFPFFKKIIIKKKKNDCGGIILNQIFLL